jgi:hypothetical protein
MRFEPQPNQSIEIFGEEYLFATHPAVCWPATYAIEGRKAMVYCLAGKKENERFALKAFKSGYRDREIDRTTRRLANLVGMRGLSVCKRGCITSTNDPELVKQYPDLEYALLMPWIQGETWERIVSERLEIAEDEALELAGMFLAVLAGLEIRGYAHCDISGANLIIGCSVRDKRVELSRPAWIELVDVEDMFGPGLTKPQFVSMGTEGYNHRDAKKGQWNRNGDRFAGAVLAAEILGWQDRSLRDQASGESFFHRDEIQDVQSPRYNRMLSALGEIGEPLRVLFEQAWESESLSQCLRMVDWLESLNSCLTSERRLRGRLRRAIQLKADDDILRLVQGFQEGVLSLDEHEWKAYTLACRRKASVDHLDQAIRDRDEIQILASLDAVLTLRPEQELRVSRARQRLEKWVVLRRALDEHDDATIRELFDASLFDESTLLSAEDRARIDAATLSASLVPASSPAVITTSSPPGSSSALLPPRLAEDPLIPLPDGDQEIVDLWQRGRIKDCPRYSDADRQRLKLAIRRFGAASRIKETVDLKD